MANGRWIVGASLLLASVLLSCGDDDGPYFDRCRFDPQGCRGGLGGACRTTAECGIGFCCREPKECGGGMCTFDCRNDLDCPSDMGCEHGVCFFMCRDDFDCARGQRCAHDHTVCEW
jgi:hypothetical protein